MRGATMAPSEDEAPRALVMGVVNVTPDSFSDGGQWLAEDVAVAHGGRLLDEGADLLDVGGESTRPGAERTPAGEELRRVLGVTRRLAEAGAMVSIDTMRADVARACVEAGAVVVNDVSGGQADLGMLDVVAAAGVDYVVGHWDPSRTLSSRTPGDVTDVVVADLAARLADAVAAGIEPERLVVDPCLGFGKDASANWDLLVHLSRLADLGHRVLVGASRKRFLGEIVGPERAPRDRDDATAALTALAAASGAWAVRVHDVGPSVDAARVARAWVAAGGGAGAGLRERGTSAGGSRPTSAAARADVPTKEETPHG